MHKFSVLLVSVLALMFVCTTANAYKVETTQAGVELGWSDSNIPVGWHLNADGAPGLSFQSVQQTLAASFATWQNVECSYLTFNYQGQTNVTAAQVGVDTPDYKNVMIWLSEDDWDGSWVDAYAVTVPLFYQQSGEIIDADILFSTTFDWSTDVNGEAGKADLQSIATHEMGHLLGLDHPGVADATMYWSAVEGEIHKRTLAADDIQGICYLYPVSGVDGSPCSSDSDCNGERSCIYNEPSGGSICSSPCVCDVDCSSDLECTNKQCLPLESDIGGLGSECGATKPCVSQDMICLNNFCSIFCEDDAECPDGWDCVMLQGGDNKKGCYTSNPSPIDGDSSDDVSISSFTVNPTSPAELGTDVILGGSATGADSIEYRYSARKVGGQWAILKDFSIMNITHWIAESAGEYQLLMEVRNAEQQECTDDNAMLSFTITDSGNVDGDDPDGDSGSGGDGGLSCVTIEEGFSSVLILLAVIILYFRKRQIVRF